MQVGWLAAAADSHLGGAEFVTKSRRMRWALTPEWFEGLKQEALAKGVPMIWQKATGARDRVFACVTSRDRLIHNPIVLTSMRHRSLPVDCRGIESRSPINRPLTAAERQARARERAALRERLLREKLDEIQTARDLQEAQAMAAEASALVG